MAAERSSLAKTGGGGEQPAETKTATTRKKIPREAVVQAVEAERETFAPEDPVDALVATFEKTSRPLSFFASTAPPPVTWQVDRLIEEATLTLAYGSAGSLKSFLIADLALDVAAGVPWMSPSPGDSAAPDPRETIAGRVIWIDADIGLRGTHRRFHALAAGHGVADAALEVLSFPPLNLDDEKAVDALVRLIEKRKARLLILDVLAHMLGAGDENDAAAMREPLRSLRRVVEATGCSIIALHHPRKGGSTGSSHDDLRGSSALAGAVDLLLRIERPNRDVPRITLVPTKIRGVEITPLSAELATESDTVGNLVSARFFGVAHQTTAQVSVAERAEEIIALLQEDGPKSSNAVVRAVKGKRSDVLKVLRELEESSRVRVVLGPRKGRTYEAL